MVLDSAVLEFGRKQTQTISEDETLGFLITEMDRLRFRRFPVVNKNDNPVGIITSSDILGAMYREGKNSFLQMKVSEIMSDDLITASEETTVREIVETMYNIGISGMPIVKNNEVLGMFTEKDLLLIDRLWKEIPDTTITHEDGPGRPVIPDTLVTENYTFWQIAEKLVNIAQRQVLVKKGEVENYIGIITIMTLLNSFVSTVTLSDPKVDTLQNISPLDMPMKSLFQRSVPIQLSSARLWMNSRGLEAFPLFHHGKPIKLLTEKDMVGYIANNISK